jgi:hypothetical protein
VASCELFCVDIKKAATTTVFKTLFGFRFAENDCANIQVLHLFGFSFYTFITMQSLEPSSGGRIRTSGGQQR